MRKARLLPQATLCLLFLLISSVEAQNEKIDKNVKAAIIFVTTPILVFIFLISLFGHRMRSTAIRFHAINISIYGILQMFQCSAYPEDLAPFKHWFKSKEWQENELAIDAMNRAVFPTGLMFLFIEQMILICAPKLKNHWLFNTIFGVLILGFVNIINFVLYNSRYWGIEMWYDLLRLYDLGVTVIHYFATFVYFLFCIFGSFCCCITLGNQRWRAKRRPALFVKMWLLFAYGTIALFNEIPNFTKAFIEFTTTKLADLIQELISEILANMDSGDGGSPLPSFITFELLMTFFDWILKSQTWMNVLFPIVNCVMTIICFQSYREQLFYFVSCGRLHKERVPHWETGKTRKVVTTLPIGYPIPVQTATFVAPPPMPVYYTAPVAYPNGVYPVQTIQTILPPKPQEEHPNAIYPVQTVSPHEPSIPPKPEEQDPNAVYTDPTVLPPKPEENPPAKEQ